MEFTFAIGEFVATKEGVESCALGKAALSESEVKYLKSVGRVPIPIRLFILERHLQECPGGIQRSYLCRYMTWEGYKKETFNEIELTVYPKEVL